MGNGQWRIQFCKQMQISILQLSMLQKKFKSIKFENLPKVWKDLNNDSKTVSVEKNYGHKLHFKFLENLLSDNRKKRRLDEVQYELPPHKIWFHEDENGQRFIKTKHINKIFENFIENLARDFHNNNLNVEKDQKKGKEKSRRTFF